MEIRQPHVLRVHHQALFEKIGRVRLGRQGDKILAVVVDATIRRLVGIKKFHSHDVGLFIDVDVIIAADVDRDGTVTINDATVLQAYLAENAVEYPIGTVV